MATFLKLKANLLADRLDAVYYKPIFIQNEERLRLSSVRTAKLSTLVERGRRSIYFSTSTLERSEAPDSWVPFLTSDDLGDEGFFVDLEARRYVAPEFAARYPQGRLRANELLIKVKGPNQTTAYNEREPERTVLVSGTIWGGLVRRDKVDPHYLVTALSSPYAAIARSRLRTNTNVEFLAADDLINLQLPLPNDPSVQAYIGDKVRQAERLRARARALEKQFEAVVCESYPAIFGAIVEKGKHSRAALIDLNTTLNPGAYNPERLRIRKVINERGGCELHKLADVITPVASAYLPNDLYVGLDAISSASCTLSPSTIGKSEVEGAVRVLQEGPVISKLRPYLNKVAYIPSELAGAFGSTELLCVRSKGEVSGWFLYGVLKLESTIRQLNPIATGATHPRVTREDVLELAVPQMDNEQEMGQWLASAQLSYFASERLTTAAKLLVEALIEGKLSEAELKEAQVALERGERAVDRAILARLTRKGIDVAGEPPLFPDLDALYAALDQTAGTQEQAVAAAD